MGRTAVEMPELPLAPMKASILACSTGPGSGLTNLSMDTDNTELYDRGDHPHMSLLLLLCIVTLYCLAFWVKRH